MAMMFLLFFAKLSTEIKECLYIVENMTDVKGMNDICNFECNNILINNITSSLNNNNAFLSLGDTNIKAAISFNDCDFSHSYCFINQIAAKQDLDIYISRTNIGAGFEHLLGVKSLIFEDCTINLNAISYADKQLTANNVKFINCRFEGSILSDRLAIFQIAEKTDDYIKVNDFNIEFIDCAFNLNKAWNKKDDGTIHTGKQFVIASMGRLNSVNINFTRCYTEVEDEELKSLRLVKIAGSENEKRKVKIAGSENGVAVEWAWITSGGDGLYNEEGEWSVVVENSGYKPNKEKPEEEKPKDEEKDNKTWMIVGIVFMIAFIIAIAVLIVFIILVKKKYNRSENEDK